MINPIKSNRNDRVISVSMLFLFEINDPLSWGERDDVIMMSGVHLYHYMINPFKSHQDRMRNGQVISVNMLFLSEISEAERS